MELTPTTIIGVIVAVVLVGAIIGLLNRPASSSEAVQMRTMLKIFSQARISKHGAVALGVILSARVTRFGSALSLRARVRLSLNLRARLDHPNRGCLGVLSFRGLSSGASCAPSPNPALNRTGRHAAAFLVAVGAARRLTGTVRQRVGAKRRIRESEPGSWPWTSVSSVSVKRMGVGWRKCLSCRACLPTVPLLMKPWQRRRSWLSVFLPSASSTARVGHIP